MDTIIWLYVVVTISFSPTEGMISDSEVISTHDTMTECFQQWSLYDQQFKTTKLIRGLKGICIPFYVGKGV